MNFFNIPEGLGKLLKDFTLSVFRERPNDLYDFAADYFAKERDSRRPGLCPMYVIVDDDDEAGEPEKHEFKPKCRRNNFARRPSVAAEHYDPEEDDSGDEKIVHPKSESQRRRLYEAVIEILLFKSLDAEQIEEVLDAMFERTVNPGEEVITQGDNGDNFYVINTGVFDVSVAVNGHSKKVSTFDNEGCFGELALMYNQPRSATVVAMTDGILWAMDRESFRRIILKSAFKKRKMHEYLLSLVPMLKHVNEYERMNLADALVTRIFEDGDQIIAEGEEADGMYFIERGTVRVTMTKNDEELEVARSGNGGYFGELALLENQPRSANVYALGPVKAAFLERVSFERLLGQCLDVMKRTTESYQM